MKKTRLQEMREAAMAKVAAAMQAYQERAAYIDGEERWAELEAACRELTEVTELARKSVLD